VTEAEESWVTFEEMEHTADWKIRVWGKDYAALFRNAALAMYTLMGIKRTTGRRVKRDIVVEAVDYPSLLVAWLNELLYHTEVDGEVFDEVRVHAISPERIEATVEGTVGEAELSKIKAATYHELTIRKTRDGVEATIVFDV